MQHAAGPGLHNALQDLKSSITSLGAALPGLQTAKQEQLQCLEQFDSNLVETDATVHLEVGTLQQHASQWASVAEAPLDDVAAQQELVAGVEATLQGAQRKQQELLTCLEAMRMLAQEHGRELDRSLDRARRCRVELSVEQHRRYNMQSNSALLALPLEVQQNIFHRVGREVREVCVAARACYGPAGSGVEVQVPAPEDMLRQLQAWPHADAVQHLRVVHLPTIGYNDPALPVTAAAFPQLQELTALVPFGTSLQLLPATLTSLHVGCNDDMSDVAHLTALRSLQATGFNLRPLLCSCPGLTAFTFTHFNGPQNIVPQALPFLAVLPANLQRLVLRPPTCLGHDGLQHLTHLTHLMHLEVGARVLRTFAAAFPWPPPHLASLQSLAVGAGARDVGGEWHGPMPDIRLMLQALPLQSLQLLRVPDTHSMHSCYLPDASAMPTLTRLAVDFSGSDGHLDRGRVADATAPFATTLCNVASFSLRGTLSALPAMLDRLPAMLPYLTDLHLEFIALHTLYSSHPPFHTVSRLTRLQRLALHSHSIPPAILSHLASLSRLSFLDLTQPCADHLPLLPLLTQLRHLKLALYPLQPSQLDRRRDGMSAPSYFGYVRRDADSLLLGEANGNCLAAVRQIRGLTELDLAGLPDRQPMGLHCLLPVPVLLQRVRVSREARAEALEVLGPHVDHISSL